MYQEYGDHHGDTEDEPRAGSADAFAIVRTADLATRQLALRAALLVAGDFGVDVCALYAPNRGPAAVAFARQMAMYLVHVTCGRNQSDVGEAFGRDRTTVAHACMIIEDRRDDETFDQRFQAMEMRLLRMLRAGGTR
ncbi:MAG: hypothetical protein KDE63_08440 [Novosphingobium sp.]|nr:hypothetical protein [Novosphingobium sp.]